MPCARAGQDAGGAPVVAGIVALGQECFAMFTSWLVA
jgi:hypothetical protein